MAHDPATTPPPFTLTDLGATLEAEAICAAARSIEQLRTAEAERLIASHHRFAVEGVMTTPFMFQAGLVARERGVFAFDRLERNFLPRAAAWSHPDVAAGYGTLSRAAERVEAPALWPFAQDCPVGDFQLHSAPKWWSHGLVHAMVGFGWWPGLTEWHVMHMARLSEAVSALHYYWLAELGRAAEIGAGIDLTRLGEADAGLYAQLELGARDAETRLARLGSEQSRAIAENAIEVLNYETFAYRHGVFEGYLVEPDEKYLDLGEAGEYAKVHHPRLMSSSFARWREHCLTPGLDYATSAEGFEERAAGALSALLTPTVPAPHTEALRAARVLQDLGQRVCHAAELAGDPHHLGQRALSVIADGIARLRTGDPTADPDEPVAVALEAVAADFSAPSAGPDARQIMALGYAPLLAPGRDPDASRAVRAEAVIARAWAVGPVLGTAFEAMRAAVRRVVDAPRQPSLVDELRPAAEAAAAKGEIYFVAEGYAGWLEVLALYWGRLDGLGNTESRWQYRLARRALPEDVGTWDQFVLELNPYLQRLPLPFDARWNREALAGRRGEIPPFKPRPPHGVNYCLVGPGRRGPVYVPITPKLNGLLLKLKAPRRLDVLAAMSEMTQEALAQAVADEVVLCHHKPHYVQPETTFNLLERLMEEADALEQRVEPQGPWEEADQAAAYEAFCARSSLYHDVSVALVEAVGIPEDARVAELGFGTGVTAQVVLGRLGPLGRLVGADPAPRMVERAYALVADDRARFIAGASRALVQVAQFEGPFERFVSNAAIWLTRDIRDELRVARSSLERGARIGLSMPAEYLGQTEHLLTPEALTVSAAIERARGLTGIAPPGGDEGPGFGADRALGSFAAMEEALIAAGFVDVRFDGFRRPWSASEYLDWVALPVVITGMCGRQDKARAGELLAALRAEIAPTTPLETAWVLITATAA